MGEGGATSLGFEREKEREWQESGRRRTNLGTFTGGRRLKTPIALKQEGEERNDC